MELKPCPFCGGEAYITNCYEEYRVECKKCRVNMLTYGTEEEAYKAWNERSTGNPVGSTMRDFEQDRRICEAASKGPWMRLFGDRFVYTKLEDGCRGLPVAQIECEYVEGMENGKFIAAAREGWPAALDEIESLKRQLQVAANMEACEGRCPDVSSCPTDIDCVECWIRYWMKCANSKDNGANSDDKEGNYKDSGYSQNGNNQSGKAGEGAE